MISGREVPAEGSHVNVLCARAVADLIVAASLANRTIAPATGPWCSLNMEYLVLQVMPYVIHPHAQSYPSKNDCYCR